MRHGRKQDAVEHDADCAQRNVVRNSLRNARKHQMRLSEIRDEGNKPLKVIRAGGGISFEPQAWRAKRTHMFCGRANG